MKEMTQREIKASALESLQLLRDYCRAHGLRCYLTFGSLLGAVRHRGFIPWDDDIDVFMPREDYRFLLEHFNEAPPKRHRIISRESCPDYYLSFAKLIDCGTRLTEQGRQLEIGVWIDIFPLDYATDDTRLYRRANRIRKLTYFLMQSPEPWGNRPRRTELAIRIIRLLLPAAPFAAAYRRAGEQVRSSEKSRHYGMFYKDFGKYGLPYLPVSVFEPAAELEFEGDIFPAPREYDWLLRYFYGDYTVLPPEKDRISRHRYTCFRKEDAE